MKWWTLFGAEILIATDSRPHNAKYRLKDDRWTAESQRQNPTSSTALQSIDELIFAA